MELKNLLNGIENYRSKGDINLDIKNIENNSKNVTQGTLFVAIKGFDFDGHEYVNEAIINGAIAVVLDISADFKKMKIPEGITVIITDNTRYAHAKIACNFYDNP